MKKSKRKKKFQYPSLPKNSPLRGKPASLYFVRSCKGTNYIKVGMTHNVERRMRQLQSGYPEQLTLIESIEFPSRHLAAHAERIIHKRFTNHRKRGEWFRCPREENLEHAILTIYNTVMEKYGTKNINSGCIETDKGLFVRSR